MIDAVSHTCSSVCPLDTVPPKLHKEAISIIEPFMLAFMNQSFLSGYVLESFKVASVQAPLKKLHVDPSLPMNYYL